MKSLAILDDYTSRLQSWCEWQFVNGTAAIALE
jgi:hypothetical protein